LDPTNRTQSESSQNAVTRRFEGTYVILGQSDLRDLANLFLSLLPESKETILGLGKVLISTNEGSEDVSLIDLANGSYLDRHTIKSISFRTMGKDPYPSVSVSINYGTSYDISVTGNDLTQVLGKRELFKEFFNKLRPQVSFTHKHYFPLALSFAAFLTLSLTLILNALATRKLSAQEVGGLATFLILPIGIFGLNFLSLWPRVEIQTGPEWGQLPKRRRQFLVGMISTVVAPLAIGIILIFVTPDRSNTVHATPQPLSSFLGPPTETGKQVGKPLNGPENAGPLRLDIRTNKASFHLGESVHLSIRIQNSGTTSLKNLIANTEAPGFSIPYGNSFYKIPFLKSGSSTQFEISFKIGKEVPLENFDIILKVYTENVEPAYRAEAKTDFAVEE